MGSMTIYRHNIEDIINDIQADSSLEHVTIHPDEPGYGCYHIRGTFPNIPRLPLVTLEADNDAYDVYFIHRPELLHSLVPQDVEEVKCTVSRISAVLGRYAVDETKQESSFWTWLKYKVIKYGSSFISPL